MDADVCLVVEGSYPYITGGVASWVHQLVTNLPEIRFALVCLVPDEAFVREDRYPVPANVVKRQNICLFTPMEDKGIRREATPELAQVLKGMHDEPLESRCPYLRSVEAMWRTGRHVAATMLTARTSWELLRHLYESRRRQVSFLDYFWTWRSTHGPLFRLFDVELPTCAVYHPVSTGYAGFIGGLAKLRHGARLMLTEHGLYTREREIEIAQAEWIYLEPSETSTYAPRERFFKSWWRNKYRFLGQISYDLADRIITLHDVNRRLQIKAGATAAKLEIVPNGIRIPEAPISGRDWDGRPFRVGLIGRVVPIKDVKTFVRAVAIASRQIAIEAFVMGPLDEDEVYAAEVKALVELLGVGSLITFTGKVVVDEWLPKLDLHVLTSISESQPLAILEAAAVGVPSVSSDVGACREMLEGRPGADALIGPSGLITPVASPEATAAAIVALAGDPARHAAMAAAGRRRVEAYYRIEDFYAAYRRLYGELAKGGA